jgi:surface protein
MSDTLKQIADNLGVTTINGNYLSGIADYYGVDLATSTDLMADILTEVGGDPSTSTDYLQDIVLALGGTVTINGNWMEAWEAITAVPALFTTEWTTTANAESIQLPYIGAGTYTGTIDWGDGNTDVNDGTVSTHTYATAGTYTVIIDGDCIGWDTNLISGSTYWTSVVNWGQLQLSTDNFGYNFAYCPNLDLSSVQGTLDLTGVTVLDGLFYDCTSLTTINNINSWDTSAITTMNSMFGNCSVFNQALSFNTSAVTNIGSMFNGCSVFNSALTFDTSFVESMEGTFSDATAFNQPLSFDTSAVTNMELMFNNATAFNQNIGTWDVANVTTFTDFMTGKTPATFSTTNLNAIYNGWSTQAVQPGLIITFGTAKYTGAATAARLVLTGTALWTITDGGL